MQTLHVLRRGLRVLWCEERGVMMAIVLILMTLLMGVGATAIYSGYTNLQTSTNLRIASRAKAQAEANVNEAIFRLSRQETDPDAITEDLNDPDWEVEIDFTSGDTNASDGAVSTLQASTDWPEHIPDDPIIVRFKRPDIAGNPNGVLFYDRQQNPKFVTYTLPGAAIPDSAHPVLQILATAQDEREAERKVLAEVTETVAFPPPAPLSSGVDVDMQGAGFIDGVNHDHRIYITDNSGNSAIYGNDGTTETTIAHTGNQCDDSPDDNVNTGVKHGVANPNATAGYSSAPRLFNMQISATDATPAWVGLTKVNPDTWTGVNTNFASPIALSDGPVVLNDTNADLNGVKTRGLFTWGAMNTGGLSAAQANPPFPTSCTNVAALVCRPTTITPFPTLQEFLGLDDLSFQNLLANPDTTKADLDGGSPPLGFTYIEGNHTFNNSDPMPGNEDFGLMYVTGNLRMNGGQRFKGLIYVDGDLDTTGDNVLLGAVMVRGVTETDANGSFTLLYSRKAAELGIQAGRPWRILSWADTEMQE